MPLVRQFRELENDSDILRLTTVQLMKKEGLLNHYHKNTASFPSMMHTNA